MDLARSYKNSSPVEKVEKEGREGEIKMELQSYHIIQQSSFERKGKNRKEYFCTNG